MLRSRLSFQSYRWPQAASALTLLVGGVVLLGWALNIDALKSVIPGLATMKPVTALSFIMSGLSLYLHTVENQTRQLQLLGRALAVLVALITLVTLSEYLLGWNSGISQLLFKQSLAGNSGQMSIATAATFLSIAASLALPRRSQLSARIAHALAILAFFIPLIALMGYVFGVQALYAFVPYSSMALHTALTLTVLCSGVVFAQNLGISALLRSDTLGSVLARRMLPAALLIPLVFGFVIRTFVQSNLLENQFGWALLVVVNNIIFALLIVGYSYSLDRQEIRRRQIERELEYANRAYRTLSAGNHVLVRAADEQSLLDEVCRVMNEIGGYTIAWVGYKIDDDLKTIRPMGSSGITYDQLLAQNLTWADNEQGRAPSGTAIRTGKPVVIQNIDTDPKFATFRDRAVKLGFGSVVALPLINEGEALGVLTVCAAEPDAFHDKELELLTEMAEDLAYGIQALRTHSLNARLYQELETYSEHLEQAVAERTEQLAATKDRVETILSSVGDALMVLRMDGSIEQINAAFERQTGYNAVEAELKDHHDLLQLEFGSKGDYQTALESLTPGQVWEGQTKVRRKDGSTYDAAMTIAPVRDTQGTIRLLVASMRDITPLKEVERAKDQFVSNVSHELRTPITSLNLNQELLRRNPAGQDLYLQRIARETDRLNDLIESLLRLSRLDQGSVQLELKPLDLNALAAQYVDDRSPLAESRGLSLICGNAQGIPLVMADSGLLGQALSVLLTNALNYTPTGGHVAISTYQREVNGRSWAGISVSDTGPGIPQTELTQLFTRFFRGSVGRKSGAPGTGLGLAIAKEIVERHKGQIEIFSEGIPGKGTSFTIWLPQPNSSANQTEGAYQGRGT